ncbi:MAG TPA: quinohemoprotein amine dehydrogenase subunit alpha [Bryobacteraceae bacterium]|nr:quinohemoprotein amine dehydrogenase subunit alpha [Bryobacteraceae bacterium]
MANNVRHETSASRYLAAILVVGAAFTPLSTYAQGRGGGRGGGRAGVAAQNLEEGIPVTDELTISKCSSCHAKDDKGNLTRISWIRTTPEGWEEAIKRMVRLNGMTLEPVEAKAILKYLSNSHGLAPEEAKPVMYMAEHRTQDEAIPNESLRATCNNCHALGRVFQWHRTRADWALLADMHSALYPQAEAAFRRNGAGRGGATAQAAGGRGGRGGGAAATGGDAAAAPANGAGVSLDATLDFLAANYPLHTPEWAAWRARMRAPRLTGRWLVTAHVAGHGRYYGDLTIAQGAAPDEFTTTVKLQPVSGGPAITRSGTGLVYTGFAWRGRSHGASLAANAVPDDPNREMREAIWFSPDQTWGEGRWFWGEYQEFGFDVKLKRVTPEPTLLTLDRLAVKTGSTALRLRVIGNNLPAQMAPADLDFGSGLTVKSIVSHNAGEIIVSVDVAKDAVPGKRDLVIGNAVLEGAIAVFDKVDYIKVLPEASMARLGGDEKSVHPRGYQQLEAVAFQRGEDGKLHTGDDIELGPVEVTWSVEEFYSVFGDDDKEFVGTLNSNGLFTPNLDGPNPQRKFSRNNYGDIWVVATAKNEKDKDGKPLVGKSYLVVTVPTYIRWDQPEVSK